MISGMEADLLKQSLRITLKGGPLSCLMLLSEAADAAPGGAAALNLVLHTDYLVSHTGYSPNSVRRNLKVLLGLGLAQVGEGRGLWAITPLGRWVFDLLANRAGKADAAAPAREAAVPPAAGEAGCVPVQPQPESAAAVQPQADGQVKTPAVPGKNFQNNDAQNFCASRQLKEEEDLDLDKDQDQDLENRAPHAENAASGGRAPPFPPVERILECSQEVLGEPLIGPSQRYPDPGRLLAWIAQAYSMRRHLHHPARLAYRRLEQGAQPRQRYLDDPCAGLPAAFLRRLGFPETFCQDREAGADGEVGEARRAYTWAEAEREGQEQGKEAGATAGLREMDSSRPQGWEKPGQEGQGPAPPGAPEEAAAREGVMEEVGQAVEAAGLNEPAGALRIAISVPREGAPACSSLDLAAGPHCPFTARKAWEHTLHILHLQMSTGIYREWLHLAVLVDFDAQDGCFTVQHPDASTCELLSGSLGERVLPDILSGVCGRPARVRFVAG